TAAMDAYVAQYPQSCYVVATSDGVVAARQPDLPMLPASTEKVLTATAALRVIGPDFRYATNAVAAAPDRGVTDRLWAVGSADPWFAPGPHVEPGTTTSLDAFADSIVANGVTRITNGIVADDSRYDSVWWVPTWRESYRTGFESGPLGALTLNAGTPL